MPISGPLAGRQCNGFGETGFFEVSKWNYDIADCCVGPLSTLNLTIAWLFSIALLPAGNTSANDLDDLLQIEQGIREVVARNMKVSVVVTDGIGYGSGVVVSADGLVLTAGHVLTTNGSKVRVIFPDGRK